MTCDPYGDVWYGTYYSMYDMVCNVPMHGLSLRAEKTGKIDAKIVGFNQFSEVFLEV